MHIETPETLADGNKNFDEDGRAKRTGITHSHIQILCLLIWINLYKHSRTIK